VKSNSPNYINEEAFDNVDKIPDNLPNTITREKYESFLNRRLEYPFKKYDGPLKQYKDLDIDIKKYIKKEFLLPDDRLNLFQKDIINYNKNVEVLKKNIATSSRRLIKYHKELFKNNNFYKNIKNNYLKIANILANFYNNENIKFNILIKGLFHKYDNKEIDINSIISFINDITDIINTRDVDILFNFFIISRRNKYDDYDEYYSIIFENINIIVAYILNYSIYIYYILHKDRIEFYNKKNIVPLFYILTYTFFPENDIDYKIFHKFALNVFSNLYDKLFYHIKFHVKTFKLSSEYFKFIINSVLWYLEKNSRRNRLSQSFRAHSSQIGGSNK
jgi:hypothetical protein